MDTHMEEPIEIESMQYFAKEIELVEVHILKMMIKIIQQEIDSRVSN